MSEDVQENVPEDEQEQESEQCCMCDVCALVNYELHHIRFTYDKKSFTTIVDRWTNMYKSIPFDKPNFIKRLYCFSLLIFWCLYHRKKWISYMPPSLNTTLYGRTKHILDNTCEEYEMSCNLMMVLRDMERCASNVEYNDIVEYDMNVLYDIFGTYENFKKKHVGNGGGVTVPMPEDNI